MHFIQRIFTTFFALISLSAFSQTPPDIDWQHCYGGTLDDLGYGITATGDGGYFFVGCAGSGDGDILRPADSEHGGTCDYWAAKTDGYGNIQFKIHLGGTGSDVAYSALQTPDGNYIIGGSTGSTDVDVVGNHGDFDFWVVKINSTPSVIWKKCFGGSGYDDFGSIINTSDGNLVMCGGTASNDGDVSGNHVIVYGTDTSTTSDFWLAKSDDNGNILWQKCYGGTGYEKAFDVKQTADGGYILAGFTDSNDGDVIGNHSDDLDGWVVKTDGNGNAQWKKCLGGTGQDGFYKVIQLSDNNFLLAGYTFSNDGDISGKHGNASTEDGWLAMLDQSGNLLWSKTYGGDSSDEFFCAQQDQLGNLDVGGFTKSSNGDLNFNNGEKDFWLANLDENGTLMWDTVYGGEYDEVCYDMAKANDGGLALMGYSTSNGGDVLGNHGAILDYYVYDSSGNIIDSVFYRCTKDYWMTKLGSVVGIHEIPVAHLNIIPTLAHDVIQISLSNFENSNAQVIIRNSVGAVMQHKTASHQSNLLEDISSLPQGIYVIEIADDQKRAVGKFVKM